mmetsp:Transcript_44391/g.78029  ORF Transcript_44391/g.78029 Transcript_44391/m.78029 type:complete len:175 (-) Transcript_44391:67-591(-)
MRQQMGFPFASVIADLIAFRWLLLAAVLPTATGLVALKPQPAVQAEVQSHVSPHHQAGLAQRFVANRPHGAGWFETDGDEWDGLHMYGSNTVDRQTDWPPVYSGGRFGSEDQDGPHTRAYDPRGFRVSKPFAQWQIPMLKAEFRAAACQRSLFSLLVVNISCWLCAMLAGHAAL